mgnify:CR=1 FL=1
MSNQNEIFCQSCEAKSINTETLIKIKNPEYLNNLIATKQISIFKNDLSQEQLT